MISVKIETPANHMTEDARWDYRVTIRFKNSTVATTANPDEEKIIKQLWPDQETYKKEEQRRFETKQRSGMRLQAIDGRVVAEHVVADFRLVHRLAHAGRGTGDGV